MIFKNDELIALLPANIKGNVVYSHQGLTYGGFVLLDAIKFQDLHLSFKTLLEYLEKQNVSKLFFKPIPRIYCSLPSDEIDYLMFKLKATLIRSDILSVVDYSNKLEIMSSNRKRGLKKALKHNLVVKETKEFEGFWNTILIPNLKRAHNVSPVHSLEEITLLSENFPKNIKQFNVYHNDKIVAGSTVFESDHVAHAQYISANEDKQALGSLDLLFSELINTIYKSKNFFDFGISNENQGEQINEGLLSWKESFGARTVSQSFYTIETKNHVLLNNVML